VSRHVGQRCWFCRRNLYRKILARLHYPHCFWSGIAGHVILCGKSDALLVGHSRTLLFLFFYRPRDEWTFRLFVFTTKANCHEANCSAIGCFVAYSILTHFIAKRLLTATMKKIDAWDFRPFFFPYLFCTIFLYLVPNSHIFIFLHFQTFFSPVLVWVYIRKNLGTEQVHTACLYQAYVKDPRI